MSRTLSLFPIAVIALLPLLLSLPTFGEEKLPNVSGHIITRKGQTITFARVIDDCKSLKFKYGLEGKQTALPLARISEVTFAEGSKTALVALKDGRDIHAECYTVDSGSPLWTSRPGYASCRRFCFYYFDDIERKENYRDMFYREISKIVIGQAVGRFRRCPHCKSTWPDAYLFCPHDGTGTVWGQPAGAVAVPDSHTRSDKGKREASLVEAILNASLARSGIDPSSEDAKKAKDFGKLWMNPLADPKEIYKKLDELRKEWHQKSGEE